MPQRGKRELSTDNRLALGRSFRLELAAALAKSQGPASNRHQSLTELGASRGVLERTAEWTEERLTGPITPAVEPALAVMGQAELPEVDAACAVVLETMQLLGHPEAWERPLEPLVCRTGRREQIRAGVFTWATDRDAFITALLGRPVPTRPSYLRQAPAAPIPVETLEDVQETFEVSVDEANRLYRGEREEVLNSPTFADVIRRGLARTPRGDVVAALLDAAPSSLSDLPVASFLAPLLRAAPGWRSPRTDMDFVSVADLGILGVVGYAQWFPGEVSHRRLRRPLAAHLRFLFDHVVAPWRLFHPRRSAHEAFLLHFRTRHVPRRLEGKPLSIQDLSWHWRALWPDDYRSEPAEKTLARLYRINERLAAIRQQADY